MQLVIIAVANVDMFYFYDFLIRVMFYPCKFHTLIARTIVDSHKTDEMDARYEKGQICIRL